MDTFGSDKVRDEILLVARVLLAALFLVSGWSKLTGFSGTVSYMAQVGAPLPMLAAIVAVVVELPLMVAIVFGILTRPLAMLLALYTLATAVIAHHYWTMVGSMRADNALHFYKNVAIGGGFLLLYVTGGGRYAVDAVLARPTAKARPSRP